MNTLPSMYTGKILDPIHGSIGMTEIEKWIIQQKIFSRLRKIKQNTLLNYVFPGANHTRFEHSIGVMHLSDEIYEKSNQNVVIAKFKSEKYTKKRNNYFISINDLIEKDSTTNLNVIKQEIRLAALLHDVGHGPTSHKFDDFTIDGKQLIKILEPEPQYFNDYIERFNQFLSNENKKGIKGFNRKIEHELVSCVFIIKMITDLKKETRFTDESLDIIKKINLDNIIKMIEPSFDQAYEIRLNDKIVTDYFNSIISSFPIDADRMDYLYRDSFYSGVKYGFYDLSRILMSVVPTVYNDRITLGIKSSGLDSVIRFIQSRNHLYNQVYFHKTNCATNTMLDFVFRHLKELDKSVMDDIKNFKSFEKFYWENSDEHFFTITLKKILQDDGCDICNEGCIENEVLDELLERKLWKRVYEKRKIIDDPNKFDDNKFSKEVIEKIKRELEEENIYIDINYSANAGLKGEEKSKIVILDKEQDYKANKNWKEFTQELGFLNQTNVFITRIYLRKTFETAKEYEAKRDIVLNKFNAEDLIPNI